MSAASLDANNGNGCVVGLNVAAAAVGGGGSGDVDVVGGGEGSQIAALDVDMKIEVKGVAAEEKSGVKKRGRPARFQSRAQPKAAQPRAQSKAQAKVVDDEEDVCFICFDGGNLVLCDRRGCPKAYHPACIKRDEAFFQSKSKWNCGWHLCSNCEKASHYMCYTCTYSLCKSCIKDADILCVRGNKGFCPLCMKTIMLIENSEQGNKDSVQVDFDDKSSWEYLFKVYWVYLKTKLSLTFDELTKSKNPGKGATSTMKIKSQEKLFGGNDDKDYSSDSFSDYQEGEDHRRKKAKKMAKLPNKEEPGNMPKIYNEKLLSVPNGEHWASEELLEFVAHVKNGDISVLSQFDVQALLLEYVKTNNLRDPRRKSQIICDSRLLKMFGKARVGHFEMLKLLELHFLNQDEFQVNNIIEGVFIGAGATQVEVDGALDNKTILGRDKKRKTRKIGVDKGPQTNLDEYAAIDVHNISLIYLRRSLMESLVDDIENFQRKIVGAVVRIRISSSDQSHDYRLVRVIGTSKVANPYKVGERTLDVMLEILNLDKKEVICIDEISNQEFSKDECIRLRRSMKCGIVERFTVGDILNKALALQAAKVNDALEAETSRLNHLRDRANEKGLRKDLRECVEKLQLLNTAEERQRRELEIPQVNADPHMDPSYESDDHGDSDHKKPDENLEPRSSNISKRGMKPIMKYGTCETVKSINGREITVSSSEQNRSMSTAVYPDKESVTRTTERENGLPVNPQNDAHRPITTEAWDNLAVVRSEPSTTDITNHNEVEKVWNYRDPSGRIQGPFSMLQLRKWSTSGYFPPDLQIWRSSDEESDTVFLTDAMNGHIHKELQVMHTSSELTSNSIINAKVNPPDVNSEVMTERSSQGCVSIEGKEIEPDYSDKSNLLISPTFSGKVSASVSRKGGEEEDRRFSESQSGPSHKPESKPQPSPVDSSTNTWDIAFTLVSITKSLELTEQNHEVDFPKLPSPTPKPNSETEDKQSVPPNDHIQDSDPNWSNNAPILVGVEAQIPVATNEWGGYSPTPTKPSNDVWDLDLNLVSGSLSEPREMNGNLASDLNAKIEELFCSSPSNPVSTTTDWQALVTGTSEFPLTDEWFPEESVSDLLAEVDAMESLNKGPLSPTSAMNCTIEGLSPTSYTGKSDAMSCSSNILMPCQSANGPNAPFQKRSGGESFTNDEAEGETQPPDSSSASWEMPGGADGDWRGGPEIIETGREQVHRNPSLNWGGPVQININMGWGNGQGNPPQANANINWVNPHGNLGPWPNQQPQYIGAERFSSQRVDRSSFLGGGGSSYCRDSRPSRNNRAAPSFGGGGSSFRPSPKGRICKFFESGHCRKGLKCDYLHP